MQYFSNGTIKVINKVIKQSCIAMSFSGWTDQYSTLNDCAAVSIIYLAYYVMIFLWHNIHVF